MNDLRKTKAYSLFIDELRDFNSFIAKIADDSSDLSKSYVEDLRFFSHKLKGSSGFFGFDDFSQKMSELEHLSSQDVSIVNLREFYLKNQLELERLFSDICAL